MSSSSPAKYLAIYQHSQRGYLLIVIAAILFIGSFMFGGADEFREGFGLRVIAELMIVIAAMFSTLTIRVDATEIRWWFALGWPGGALALAEIDRAELVRTSFFEGWGVHLTWHGWLWNVSGFNAVELHRAGKVAIALGTNDPEGLQQAIARARGT